MVQGLTVERSVNYALLDYIAKEPSIWEATRDDFPPDDYTVPQGNGIYYLLAHDGDDLLGFCAFWPQNAVCFDAHLCFRPCAYGKRASFAFRIMLNWMWINTKAQRIVGSIPVYNRLAIAFCKRAGGTVYGVNPKSWVRDGKLHDQVLIGMSRP